jgi:hypothetical protein
LASFSQPTCPRVFSNMIRLRQDLVPKKALVVKLINVTCEHVLVSIFYFTVNFNVTLHLQVLDQKGVGELVKIATERGRRSRPDLEVIN